MRSTEYPGNWLKREIRPVARKLGVRMTGYHDFRHFFATQLRRSGTHPKVVSNLLGHTGVVLAMDVYTHLDAEDLSDVATPEGVEPPTLRSEV